MEIDYSPYLHVLQNGTIWWSLADAIKLGAGFLPMRDEQHNLDPVLRAKNNQVRAHERTLWSEFSQDHYTDDHPRFLERDDCRYVEAHEFLDWLSRHLVTQTKSKIIFPGDLARAVRKATGAPDARSAGASKFDGLTIALEKWFNKPLAELPKALQQRIEQELSPMPWDSLTGEQRRHLALQWDYQHDPATLKDRQFWWDLFERMDVVKKHIAQWEAVATPTALEMAQKESRLGEFRRELARMDAHTRQGRVDHKPEPDRLPDADEASISPGTPSSYIAYPKAMHQLIARLGATPEELAAWVHSGPKEGGLAAYMNANELDPPPRFHFGNGCDCQDYMAPLMACWFRADDIERFEPAERYIVGAALIERWSKQAGLHAAGFIQAKIAESRLLDIHPIYGGTRGTFSEHPDWPPLESGLFPLSQVELIEAEDFADHVERSQASIRPKHLADDAEKDTHGNADQGATVPHSAIFLAMAKLSATELRVAFVGDLAESGLGANNMLEISARGKTKRIPLAALDLVDRRRGCLNSQGVILLGMAHKKKLTRTELNARKMSRLRDVFRDHLGITKDPFESYRKGVGWIPLFKISDKRGAADERAKRDAERRTDSYEELTERGSQFAAADQSQQAFYEEENDAASAWLKENDTEA